MIKVRISLKVKLELKSKDTEMFYLEWMHFKKKLTFKNFKKKTSIMALSFFKLKKKKSTHKKIKAKKI